MKKIPAILLALSLPANILLAILLHRAYTAPPGPAASKPGAPPTRADSAIVASMQARDINALLAQLKDAGLPDKTARYITAAIEFQKFADQMSKLTPQSPHWRDPAPQTPGERLKAQQMMLAFQSSMRDLMSDILPQFDQQYSYLTPGRRAELRRLEKDYDDLNAEMFATSGGFLLQSDNDKIRLLADERKRELEQFFTPDEIAARDMRESSTARAIRSEYGNIIENETEYQTIYTLLKEAGDDPGAQAAARAQIDATLGSERLERLAHLNDPDYQIIQAAAARLDLPPAETTAAITGIRSEAQELGAAIMADPTLTAEEKKNALQDIARKSRAQMDSVLGSEGAAAYAMRSRWMSTLQRGASFTIDSRGRYINK